MAIEAVIFDIGNVLLHWQPQAHYDRVLGTARSAQMFAEVPLFETHLKADQGGDMQALFTDLADRHPDWRAEIRMWVDDWLSLVPGQIDRSVETLHALRRQGLPVFALSNFPDGVFDLTETAFPFLQDFDRRYISGRLKMAKPDAAIFAHVEADCGIAPDRLLFADDSPPNIRAARARGWQTHLFKDPENWEACLAGHGLLEPAAS